MPYSLTYSLGTLVVNDGSLNTQTSLTIPGYDAAFYGQPVDQNQLSLLENFASSPSPGPLKAIPGQLWYDRVAGILKVNNSVSSTPNWSAVGPDLPIGGSNGQVQFNNNGQFAGNSNFRYDRTSDTLIVGNIIANISGNIIANDIIANTINSNTVNATDVITNLVDANIGNITIVNSTNINTSNIFANMGNITTVNATNIITSNISANIGNITTVNSTTVNATDINTGNIFANMGNITTVNAVDLNSTTVNATDVITNLVDANIGNITIVNSTTVNAATVAATNVNANVVTANVGNITVLNATTVNGTLGTAAQPNITSVGTLGNLTVSGNVSTGGIKTDNYYYANGDSISFSGTYSNSNVASYLPTYTGNLGANVANVATLNTTGDTIIGGNLTVNGTTTYINITNLQVQDPLITAGGGPNGAPLTSNDGKDRGTLLDYYTSSPQTAFMGWDNSTGYMTIANNVTHPSDIVTVNSYGTLRAGTAILDGLVTPTLSTGAALTAGTITGTWGLSAGSTLTATYADLGEKYVADAHYEPGTVVEFGGDYEVTVAQDGTRAVAGVVSTNAAYIMNSACVGDHVVTIALQGRVPCKVRGRIRKGDMMISGGDGYARPSYDPQIGSIIGKALENFDGIGVIEVAVGRL